MDLTDIALATEELKKKPHFLDKLPATKNTTGKTSADNKRKINRFLPKAEKEQKLGEYYQAMLNTTSRAGAGGTKLGLPGIRPSGGKAASKFLDDFIGTGRFQKPPEPFSQKKHFLPSNQNTTKKPRAIIFDRCMDCLKLVHKDDAIPNLTFIPPPEQINPIAKAKWASVRIRPGDIIGYLFHAKCVRAAVSQMQLLGQGVITFENGKQVTAAQRFARERSQKVSDNVHSYLVNECLRESSECYYDV
jgi:hypothetical protein